MARAQYALQGWRREKIYPDFILAVDRGGGANRVAVLEMKGEHLAANADSEYKRTVLQLLSKIFMWDQSVPAGKLELVQDTGETVECDLVLMKDWRTKLPGILSADGSGLASSV